MTVREFKACAAKTPILAAVKNEDDLRMSRSLKCKIIYVLYGDICNIKSIIETVHGMGKYAIVHIDLINGFSSKDICVDYMQQHAGADGIISTKPHLIKRARELGLFSVQRFWVMDAITYYNVAKYVKNAQPDIVDLMPAGLNKAIRYLNQEIDKPMMASGLVLDKEDVRNALDAGAIALSTANKDLWM